MGLSRFELFTKLGILKIVDPLVEKAYSDDEDRLWRGQLDDTLEERGHYWHTSFHASEFPGDDEKACARKALYGLLNIPETRPVERMGRQIMDVGKSVETHIVDRLYRAGLLLGVKDPADQLRFEVPEIWLSGSCDAVILPPGWNRGHVWECKGKDRDPIWEMQAGQRQYDPEHRRQIMAYIGLAHAVSPTLWPDLEPVRDGTLYYFNRARPHETHEFFFELDEEFAEKGIKKLEEWKLAFEEDRLPERDKSWRYTEHPCDWCDVKKLCKLDTKEGVTKLSESNAVKFAQSLNPAYDYHRVREAVFNRWKEQKNA